MSLSSIRSALKTKLDAITGIENVFDYVYWTDDWQTIYDNFAKDSRINCWFIGLTSRESSEITNGIISREYTFDLFAYYSFKSSNESSKSFEALLDAVQNDFETSHSFVNATNVNSVELVSIESTLFAGTPAHRGNIRISITEEVAQDIACDR